jgi:hypothetical protein
VSRYKREGLRNETPSSDYHRTVHAHTYQYVHTFIAEERAGVLQSRVAMLTKSVFASYTNSTCSNHLFQTNTYGTGAQLLKLHVKLNVTRVFVHLYMYIPVQNVSNKPLIALTDAYILNYALIFY